MNSVSADAADKIVIGDHQRFSDNDLGWYGGVAWIAAIEAIGSAPSQILLDGEPRRHSNPSNAARRSSESARPPVRWCDTAGMPLARLSGADIQYEIIVDKGPWVALVSGGRNPLLDLAGLGRDIADLGYQVLLHDRRGCGRSSLDFDSLEPEEDVWADDLAELLDLLEVAPAIIGGRSRGARVALRFSLRHGAHARALVLWGDQRRPTRDPLHRRVLLRPGPPSRSSWWDASSLHHQTVHRIGRVRRK
jgi:pimeloyl-ACP methyl ester carboxylesterase